MLRQTQKITMEIKVIIILFIGLGLIALFFLFKGIYHHKSITFLKDKKTIKEDLLKELYALSEEEPLVSLSRLQQKSKIAIKSIKETLDEMQKERLIERHDEKYILTLEGKNYALRIVRAHRLYEKYLAENTGYAPDEWHSKAEQMEHHLQERGLQKIVDVVGDPRYDPHGDPIPTPYGEVKPLKGQPLTTLNEGEIAKIIHIEDEPPKIYKKIRAKKIHIGALLQMKTTIKGETFRFYSEGEEFELSPTEAKNITVLPLYESNLEENNKVIRLTALSKGEEAEVVAISGECRGANRRRLLDLGFVKGSKIKIDLISPYGNPKAYLIRETSIALRNDQARHILIKRKEK